MMHIVARDIIVTKQFKHSNLLIVSNNTIGLQLQILYRNQIFQYSLIILSVSRFDLLLFIYVLK